MGFLSNGKIVLMFHKYRRYDDDTLVSKKNKLQEKYNISDNDMIELDVLISVMFLRNSEKQGVLKTQYKDEVKNV
jgi:hypothetical protein